MNSTTLQTKATDHDMLKYYGMAARDTIATDISITNVEARILAELVGQEESEAWSTDPMVASRLADLCRRLLKAAAAGDAEVAA
jgi:hypothetical protein